MWGQLLNAVDVSAGDDFFSAGGHSLLAMQLVSLIAAHFSVRVAIGALVSHSSLESMASLIDRLRSEAGLSCTAAGVSAAGPDSDQALPLKVATEVRSCLQYLSVARGRWLFYIWAWISTATATKEFARLQLRICYQILPDAN
jgi:hypothetical protein